MAKRMAIQWPVSQFLSHMRQSTSTYLVSSGPSPPTINPPAQRVFHTVLAGLLHKANTICRKRVFQQNRAEEQVIKLEVPVYTSIYVDVAHLSRTSPCLSLALSCTAQDWSRARLCWLVDNKWLYSIRGRVR